MPGNKESKSMGKRSATKLERLIEGLLYALLFLFPWQTIWIYGERALNGVKWQWGTEGYYATELLLWVVIILSFIWFYPQARAHIAKRKVHATPDRRFAMAVLLLALFGFASTFWAPVGALAQQQALRLIAAFLFFFCLLAGPIKRDRALLWFLAGAVVQSFFGIAQSLAQVTFSSTLFGLSAYPAFQSGSVVVEGAGRLLRAYGGFSHPNMFGGYLLVALTLLLSQSSWRTSAERVYRLLYLGAALLFVTALFLTFSRSAWIGLGMLLVFIIWHAVKKKDRAIATFSIALMSLFFGLSVVYAPFVSTRLFGGEHTEVRSVGERVNGYGEAIDIIKSRPIIGTGMGNYTAAAYIADPSRDGWSYQPVHTLPLLILAELGVVGLGLILFLIGAFFAFVNRIVTNDRWAMIVISSTIFLPIAFFDHYLWTAWTGLLLMPLLFALLLRQKG